VWIAEEECHRKVDQNDRSEQNWDEGKRGPAGQNTAMLPTTSPIGSTCVSGSPKLPKSVAATSASRARRTQAA
jgi:hypothetical protein